MAARHRWTRHQEGAVLSRPNWLGIVLACLCTHGGSAWAQAGGVPELNIGQAAPEFSALDENGKHRQLSDFRGSYVVLEWTNRACAFVKKYYGADDMQALQHEARARNVVWLTVSSTPPGHAGYMDAEGAQRFRNRYQSEATAILLDPDGRLGRQYDVEVTPELFIIDPDGKLVYTGGMDDRPSSRIADIDEATDYVGEALDDALAERPVSQPITRAYGCPIEY
jgi:peroxiredoxin